MVGKGPAQGPPRCCQRFGVCFDVRHGESTKVLKTEAVKMAQKWEKINKLRHFCAVSNGNRNGENVT